MKEALKVFFGICILKYGQCIQYDIKYSDVAQCLLQVLDLKLLVMEV